MSAVVGPIHHWLYRKIELQQNIVVELIVLSNRMQVDGSLEEQLTSRYGSLTMGALEDCIDGTNIHGWLQERVSQVEYQLAYAVTQLVAESGMLEEIRKILIAAGRRLGLDSDSSAEQYYRLIQDVLLDGMPCDRVHTLLHQTQQEVLWRRTNEVHQKYWDEVGGSILLYEQLRDSFMRGLLENSDVHYETLEDQTYRLRKGECHE